MSKSYLDFILDQLSELEDVPYRGMMGESIIYYRGKVVGGIYDDRFRVKSTISALTRKPTASMEHPYVDAKEMVLVDDVETKEFLCDLLRSIYDELPSTKKKSH